MGNSNPILQLVGPQAQRKENWTMSRDGNIYSDLSPYHGKPLFLGANDNLIDCHGA